MTSFDKLRRPGATAADTDLARWFCRVAAWLLNEAELLVCGEPHVLVEVEAYYFHPDLHPDPFTHRHPVQHELGRWHFHRVGGSYRGGTFKGVDLTFGDADATFGMLIRSIVAPSGEILVGPSRIVDYLLDATGESSVASLDARIAARPAWDLSSPLAIRSAESPRTAPVLATPRVGLWLKRHRGNDEAKRFLLLPYRYLTEPRRITKGRPQTVLALNQIGHDPEAIRDITGVPARTIDRYLRNYERGRQEASLEPYFGRDLTPENLCRLIGSWSVLHPDDHGRVCDPESLR